MFLPRERDTSREMRDAEECNLIWKGDWDLDFGLEQQLSTLLDLWTRGNEAGLCFTCHTFFSWILH